MIFTGKIFISINVLFYSCHLGSLLKHSEPPQTVRAQIEFNNLVLSPSYLLVNSNIIASHNISNKRARWWRRKYTKKKKNKCVYIMRYICKCYCIRSYHILLKQNLSIPFASVIKKGKEEKTRALFYIL